MKILKNVTTYLEYRLASKNPSRSNNVVDMLIKTSLLKTDYKLVISEYLS